MLPSKYKFYVYNSTGVTLASSAITIDVRPWKFDTNGALSYGTEVTKQNANTLATAAGTDIGASPDIDNSTDKFLGAHVRISIATTGSPTSTASIYLRKSHDGTDYEDATSHLIAVQSHAASGTIVYTKEI